jgi:hypothetical protein
MDAGRKLTAEEKRTVEARVLAKEQAAHPGSQIGVDVADVTGADGKPRYKVYIVDIISAPKPPPGVK